LQPHSYLPGFLSEETAPTEEKKLQHNVKQKKIKAMEIREEKISKSE